MNEYEVIKALDSVIAKHMIRLIGTDKGVNGLPLTLVTITALVLLWEKEQGSPDLSAPPKRYTKEELMEEMEQLGLSLSGPLAREFQELFDRRYIHLGQDGMAVPLEPALKTARLLDVLFKGMPGMTLVAYLVQLFCEVMAGQKDIELAASSVDATLTNVGVLPGQKTSLEGPPEKGASMERIEKEAVARAKSVPRETPSPPGVRVEIEKVKEALRLWRQQKKRKTPKLITADGKAKIMAGGKKRRGAPAAKQQTPDSPKEKKAEATPPPHPEKPKAIEPTLRQSHKEPATNEHPHSHASLPEGDDKVPSDVQEDAPVESPREVETGETKAETPSAPIEPASHEKGDDAAHAEETAPEGGSHSQPTSHGAGEPEGPYAGPEAAPPAEEAVMEEDVEAQIEKFKKKKALRCPECGRAELKENRTAAGKSFYACANPGCHFISWGPPVYVPCSRCKAAYTIEMREGEKRWLECVNAACGFKQPHPDDAPRKKRRVVRRRVVRRRRK